MSRKDKKEVEETVEKTETKVFIKDGNLRRLYNEIKETKSGVHMLTLKEQILKIIEQAGGN